MTDTKLPPKKRRQALEALSRDRLKELTELFRLEVADKRRVDLHVEALLGAGSVSFAEVLDILKRDELKQMCAALGLDTGGRERHLIATRILTHGDAVTGKADDFQLSPPEAKAPAAAAKKATKKKAAKKSGRRAGGRSRGAASDVLSYRHEEKRKNNPHVGLVNERTDADEKKTRWSYDPHLDPALQFDIGREQIERLIDDALASGDDATMRKALLELKRLQSPYLQWTGKAERTSFEVDTVSLHVHERIDPMSILSSVRKRMKGEKDTSAFKQPGLFDAPFENLPLREAVDFYKHERGWTNRMVAGDSLLVMNSLLQKESMAGQVQMIYIDPPYGIKYGSNFQPFVGKRDVKDRKDEDLTQEPEMIKAFRDTWELGIHSYLTYLRDRLLLARELLSESGSVFVQISDENVHHVRELMDEVFGVGQFCSLITYRTKTMPLGSEVTEAVGDYLVWYCKNAAARKVRPIFVPKNIEGDPSWSHLQLPNGDRRRLTAEERSNHGLLTAGGRVYQPISLLPAQYRPNQDFLVEYQGTSWSPPKKSCWSTDKMGPVVRAGRVHPSGESLRYVLFHDDYPVTRLNNMWGDTAGARDKAYVVQTNEMVIERCLLMTTDPGDLVLDPTCGSGTTAFVAEKWGRRWITCDTSRVAITLAKQRLMTASFDYYDLKYPQEGVRSGFVYKTVPHVTLKSIANNPEIDAIYERRHPGIDEARAQLNAALQKDPPAKPFVVTEGGRKGEKLDFAKKGTALEEWEVPFDFPAEWPEGAKAAFELFHEKRRGMQQEMDASIAAHADQEILYDQPQVARDKLRITGPFTVEAVPFATVLSLEEAQKPTDADVSVARSGESARQHQWKDELLKTGVRGKNGQMLRFAELETLPNMPEAKDGGYLHAAGTLVDTGERVAISFGPEHAALEQRQVQLALNQAEKLRPQPRFVLFCAFAFDPEASKDIDETQWPGVTLLKAQMNTDLLTEDLKKNRASNQSFWLMGQPDVDLRKTEDGKWQVEVNGFDYFDTVKGDLISGGKKKIAVWMLDTDYDERSLLPHQVFFPLAGRKDGWNKLKRTIRAELDEELLEQFHGTVSLPFEAGENRRVAVKLVDDRGIESLKIIPIPAG